MTPYICCFKAENHLNIGKFYPSPSRVGSTVAPVADQCEKKYNSPVFEMDENKKLSLKTHFKTTLMEQQPNVFHRTMLNCIHASPKLNAVIACQQYCYRDLTKWPKLNRLSQGQSSFYDHLIYSFNLDGHAVSEAVYSLGVIHYSMAQYGMKPHFLDLWRQQFEQELLKLNFEEEGEKTLFIESFNELNEFVCEVMNVAYSRCQQESMKQRKSLQTE